MCHFGQTLFLVILTKKWVWRPPMGGLDRTYSFYRSWLMHVGMHERVSETRGLRGLPQAHAMDNGARSPSARLPVCTSLHKQP